MAVSAVKSWGSKTEHAAAANLVCIRQGPGLLIVTTHLNEKPFFLEIEAKKEACCIMGDKVAPPSGIRSMSVSMCQCTISVFLGIRDDAPQCLIPLAF